MPKVTREERLARKAAVMKFDGRDLDTSPFEAKEWLDRMQSLQQLNLIAVKVLGKSDVELTEMLADAERREEAGDTMVQFAASARNLRAMSDIFDAISMRLLCACARHEYGLDRDGKPVSQGSAS